MQYSEFFDEIFGSLIVATDSALAKYGPYLAAHREGKILEFPEATVLKLGFFDSLTKSPYQNEAENKTAGVAIVPVQGLLTKNGSWWDPGTDEIAESLFELYADPLVKAIVLDVNSPGGTTHSVIPMEHAIGKRNKPVISAVNPQAYSSANYIVSLTDVVFSTHRMGETGSIGVMATWTVDKKDMWGNPIKRIEIYPPESDWKNLASRQAEEGKTKLYQDDILTPWALHFQNIMKANRKKLDLTVEGILNGRNFYAYDAVTNGLIDGIKPMDEILQYAFDYSTRKKFETL